MTTGFGNFKRKTAIIAVVCMILTLIPSSSFALETSDISNHWAGSTIQSWIDKGLVKGYEDGTFKPENNITRAEFMTLVNGAFGYTKTATTNYKDVATDSWYANAIAKATAAGYITGYPDGTMRPDNPISREEAASIITKITKYTENAEAANKFADAASMTWSKGLIGAVSSANIMNGYPDGTFVPQYYIKRCEAIVSLNRIISAPAAPSVTMNDDTNKVFGMTTGMEYKLDSNSPVAYNADVFNEIDFSGSHTLLVRFAASGEMPASLSTTLTFTTNAAIIGGGGSGSGISTVAVSDIKVTPTTMTLPAGGATGTITATITPDNATNKTITWTTSDANVATVTNGVVTPVAAGTATITATSAAGGSKKADCVVTVKIAATMATTGLTGIHGDKVYQEFQMKVGDAVIDLSATNVESISVVNPDATEVTLTPDTDSTLWFNVQKATGDYKYTVIDKTGKTYEATLAWTAPTEVTAIATGQSGDHEGITYAEYKLGELDLSSFDAMYEFKADKTIVALTANTDTNLWFNVGSPVGNYTFLVYKGGVWSKAVIAQI